MSIKRFIALGLVAALLTPAHGCATVRNTKIPKAFNDVGICGSCKNPVALDGLLDSDVVVCPECGSKFIVRDARLGFRKSIVDRKNRKAAQGILTVAWMAVTIAGSFYGIPLPPPPITVDTFAPYRAPLMIKCRKAAIAEDVPPYYAEKQLSHDNVPYGNLYILTKLPNPYEAYRSPYSITINDYSYDNTLEISPPSHTALKFGSALLEMKN